MMVHGIVPARPRLVAPALLALATLGTPSTHAAARQDALRIELEARDGSVATAEPAGLEAVDLAAGALRFVRVVGEREAPFGARPDAQRIEVALAGGDRVSAALVGGRGDDLVVLLPGLETPLALSVDHLAGFEFPALLADDDRAGLARPAQGDRLYWVRGSGLDAVDGTLESFEDGGVRFDGVLGSRVFPWAEVAALYIEVLEDGAALPREGAPVAVDLFGAGRLRGRATRLDREGLALRIPGAPPFVLPLSALEEVFVDDGSAAFLSDLPPSEFDSGSPFGDDLGMVWPHRVDRSVSGRPLRAGGRVWRRGLGVHAPSRLAWELPAGWTTLTGFVALDDEVLSLPKRGSVVFRVRVDGALRWESPIVRGGEAPRAIPPIALPADSGARLELEVDVADDSFVADRADWLRLQLTKN